MIKGAPKGLFMCFLFAVLSLGSCAYVADDIFDCIINSRPVLRSDGLEDGTVDTFYSDYVYGEIENNPNDDNFDYYFDVYGNLPNGVDWYVDYRTVVFEGIPTRPGRYHFTVELWVEGPLVWNEATGVYDDNLCTDFTERNYTIVVR